MSDDTLDAGGRHLWASLVAQDGALEDEANPARATALEACRTKDRLDLIDAVCRSSEPMLETDKGLPIAHPAYVEARQQAMALARLLAVLRLPDEATGKRPQRRPVRGVVASPTSSARDRMRAV